MTTKSASEIAEFLTAFQRIYPFAMSRKQKRAIWSIARKLYEEELSLPQALLLAGIPPDVHESDLKDSDRRVWAFLALLATLVILLGYGAGQAARRETTTKPEPIPPKVKEQVFVDLFQSLEADEEPEEWIDVVGEPVPVLAPRGKPTPSKAKPSGHPKQTRTETSAATKPTQRAKAKSRGKNRADKS